MIRRIEVIELPLPALRQSTIGSFSRTCRSERIGEKYFS